MENDSKTGTPEEKGFKISRLIGAPVYQVYRSFTEAEQLSKWWGPKDFTNPVCEIDLRPGGEIRIEMKGPDGTVYPMAGIIMDIIEPERLVFNSTALATEIGNWQLEVFNTVSFDAEGSNTLLTVQVSIIKETPLSEHAVSKMEQAWHESLDKLNALLTEKK